VKRQDLLQGLVREVADFDFQRIAQPIEGMRTASFPAGRSARTGKRWVTAFRRISLLLTNALHGFFRRISS
jgi:hypothetical protein